MLEDDSTIDTEALYELDLFQGLDIAAARKYLTHAEHHILPKGEILLSPRSNNSDLYIVLNGLLSVHLDSPNSDLIATISMGEQKSIFIFNILCGATRNFFFLI